MEVRVGSAGTLCVCVMGQVGGWMSRQHDGAVLQQLFLSDSELILRMSC